MVGVTKGMPRKQLFFHEFFCILVHQKYKEKHRGPKRVLFSLKRCASGVGWSWLVNLPPRAKVTPLHQKIAGVPSDQGLWKPLGFPQQPAKNWRAGVYRGRGEARLTSHQHQLSSDQNLGYLLYIYGIILPSYIGIMIISHYNDPI